MLRSYANIGNTHAQAARRWAERSDEAALQLLHGCCEELMGLNKKQQLRGVRSKIWKHEQVIEW